MGIWVTLTKNTLKKTGNPLTTELLILSSRSYELSNGVSVGYHWQRKEEERLRQYKCLFLNASPIHENVGMPKSFFPLSSLVQSVHPFCSAKQKV